MFWVAKRFLKCLTASSIPKTMLPNLLHHQQFGIVHYSQSASFLHIQQPDFRNYQVYIGIN